MDEDEKISHRFKFRLLPITMMLAMLVLGMKLNDIYYTGSLLSQANAEAADKKEEEKTAESEKPEDAKAETKDTKEDNKDAAKEEEKKAEGDKEKSSEEKTTDNADDAHKTDGEHTAAEGEEKSADADKETADADSTDKADKKEEPKKEYSQLELDVLQNLSKRREELDNWEKEVELKEKLLTATEQRINDKILEIKSLKTSVDALLLQYNEREDAKIRSLVKIYENMKPKEAASIFEELDMPVLLLVVDKMSERKVAPVLAGMSPRKAMEVTTQLAEQRKLQTPLVSPDMSGIEANKAEAPSPAPAAQPTPSAN